MFHFDSMSQLDVSLIMNAKMMRFAEIGNVNLHATFLIVVEMHTAKQKITEHIVFVKKTLKEIHIPTVRGQNVW